MGTDREIVRIAERRSHVVTNDDLQRLGLNERARERAANDGILHRVVPGAYSVAPLADPVAQLQMVLCLTHPELVLSHASAAAFWNLRRARKDIVEVTVPQRSRIRGIPAVVHRSNNMPDDHIVVSVDGLRVTSAARTVFDLGGFLDASAHRSIIDDVRNRNLCTDDELGDVYRTLATKGRRGSAAWSRLEEITQRVGRPTMSDLELAFQDALVATGLPPAHQQYPMTLPNGQPIHVDLAYPSRRLALEVDHTAWHNTASAVERDKVRDLELGMVDWLCVRFTERMLANLPMCAHKVRVIYEVRAERDQAA